MVTAPVLFLDVDGTINIIPEDTDKSPDSEWDDLTLHMVANTAPTTPAFAQESSAMWLSAEMCSEINNLGCEIRWLTAWGDAANAAISPLVGLPKLKVAAQPDWENGSWKWDTVRTFVLSERRPFVWADNNAIWGPQREWAEQCGVPNLLVRTDETKGITRDDIVNIRQFVGVCMAESKAV